MQCVKRAFDVIASLVALILLFPLLALIALLVRCCLGSPVLFSQLRVGKDEKIFRLYKFRSMLNACSKDGNPLPDAERLTHFGTLLRSTSLDELPELYNVLMGDMSLVGPRPLLPEYLPYYSPIERTRHRMRPGLTGLAQINGRNALSWEARLALDAKYVAEWSILLDAKILLGTVRVVLARQGINAENQATMDRFDDHVRKRQLTQNASVE